MLHSGIHNRIFFFASVLALLLLSTSGAAAQSTEQDFPTPVHSSDIFGTIHALDVGDPRLTHHFYAFNGTHGDLLVTVESRNLNGDVDVFTAVTLKPLLKIPMYAGASSSITTKSIYMRAEDILILRVEARSPNDDDGTYRIRLGGAFAPFSGGIPVAENEATETEKRSPGIGTRRVSSVGARVEEPIVTAPASAVGPAKNEEPVKTDETSKTVSSKGRRPVTRAARNRSSTRARPKPAPAPEKTASNPPADTKQEVTREPTEQPAAPKPAPAEVEAKRGNEKQENPASPGAHLIIEQKDGTRIDRPMSTVRRIMIDNGQIVIFLKNGRIQRVSMTDVARMAIGP